MQQPTLRDTRLRSTADAQKIFLAVQKGTLKMVTKRLDIDERLALRSGNIYCWEERSANGEITGLGIERFTEGRRWSPSRVRDEFLFYYEKWTPPPDNGGSGSKHPPRDWDPLVKQTYSVWVETEKGKKKWHLTAYFTQNTVDQLGTVDKIPGVGDLSIPYDHFKSTRVPKNRAKQDRDDNKKHGAESSAPTPTQRLFAPFPSSFPIDSPTSPSDPAIQMYDPYASQDLSASNIKGQYGEPSPTATETSHMRSGISYEEHAVHRPVSSMSSASSSGSSNAYVSPTDTSMPHTQSPLSAHPPTSVNMPYAYGSDSRAMPPPGPYHSAPTPVSSHPNWGTSTMPYAVPLAMNGREARVSQMDQYSFEGPPSPAVPDMHLSPDVSSYSQSPGYELSPYEQPNGSHRMETKVRNYRGQSSGLVHRPYLAPITSLERAHPYPRRHPVDDRTIRTLHPDPEIK